MPRIQETGASIVAISPQLPEHSAKISKRHKLAFDVLSDPGNEVARAWGLVHAVEGELRTVYEGFGINLERSNGDTSWTLPMPARIVIGTDGKILAVDTDPDYTRRPEPETTVSLLTSLS